MSIFQNKEGNTVKRGQQFWNRGLLYIYIGSLRTLDADNFSFFCFRVTKRVQLLKMSYLVEGFAWRNLGVGGNYDVPNGWSPLTAIFSLLPKHFLFTFHFLFLLKKRNLLQRQHTTEMYKALRSRKYSKETFSRIYLF